MHADPDLAVPDLSQRAGATRRVKVGLGIVASVARHPAVTAMEIATLARAYPGRFLPGVDSAVEMERLADKLPIEQVAKRWIVASDPDEAIARIKPYIDAELNHLVFHGPGHNQERFLTQFAEDVLPKLRAI
ncbi:MAG: flavin-dependent oxidoreductase [Pseudonocardia sp.]|nr:flavin-dependent oxidoreductase [Pseudonocardia sp.]